MKFKLAVAKILLLSVIATSVFCISRVSGLNVGGNGGSVGDIIIMDGGTTVPDTTEADTTEADTTEADTTDADTTVADTTAADTTEADTTVADTTAADTTEADTTAADTTEADTTEADTTEADTTEADTTEADTTAADTTEADTTAADTTEADTMAPDTDITDMPQESENVFADIKSDDWFFKDIMFVYNKKLMTGTANDTFSPHIPLTRAMIITILYRYVGDSGVYQSSSFTDVENDSWYGNAVNWGYANKIINGTSATTFSPFADLTREQLCVMLFNCAKHLGADISFADITTYSDHDKVSYWAKEAISWAVSEKIVNGKDSKTLAPAEGATRAEAAAVIRRFAEKFTEA